MIELHQDSPGLVEDMIDYVEIETTICKLPGDVGKTKRRVDALEFEVIPISSMR